MSLNGTQTNIYPNSLDGLQTNNVDSIYINGQIFDPTNLVPYNNSIKDLDMGSNNIKTSHAPTANDDVVNLLTLQNAVTYIDGINVANFVRYAESNANTDLGTYTISSSTAPTTANNLTNKTYVDTQDALKVPYSGATANVNLGSNTITASTAKFTAVTSATPSLALGVDASGNLNTFAVPTASNILPLNNNFTGTNTFSNNVTTGLGYTTDLNGVIQTKLNSLGFTSASFTTSGITGTYTPPLGTITNPSGSTYQITQTAQGRSIMAISGFAPSVQTTYIFQINIKCTVGTAILSVEQDNVLRSPQYYQLSTSFNMITGSFYYDGNPSTIIFKIYTGVASWNAQWDSFTLSTYSTTISSGITATNIPSGTATAGLGLNASKQVVTTVIPPNFSALSVGSVPYESSSDVFSNSIMTQGLTDFGYTGASFTASTGIGSITFASPTYTANSSASFQGIITLSALPATALNLPCTATFTALSFPFFAVSPYPYFTLTNGSTVVYTSATGASGTFAMPFTPTSTTLFVTIYFKAPPTPQTAGIFTWQNFTITTPIMTTTGSSTTTGNNTVNRNLTVNGDTTLVTTTTGTTSTGNLTVRAGNTITKVGGNSGANFFRLQGEDTGSSPYTEYHFNNLRRMYVGNATASDAIIASENSAQLTFATQGANRMFIDTAGNVDVSSRELRISQLNSVCQIRMKSGNTNIASMFHCNGNGLYLLATNTGDWTGSYNGLRPFYVDLVGGGCFMSEGLNVNGGSISCANQPFCIVGGVPGASVFYPVGAVWGAGSQLVAYTSAGMSNSGTSGWSSGAGAFFFTKTGRWQVNWSFYWNNFAGGSRGTLLHFNSAGALLETRYCALNASGIGGDTTQAYSSLIYGSAGDFLQCQFQSGSGTLYFGGITHTHVTFHFLG